MCPIKCHEKYSGSYGGGLKEISKQYNKAATSNKMTIQQINNDVEVTHKDVGRTDDTTDT